MGPGMGDGESDLGRILEGVGGSRCRRCWIGRLSRPHVLAVIVPTGIRVPSGAVV